MRHTFRFPPHIRRAVREHVERAVSDLSPKRYRQEPSYSAALAGRLEGTAYEGDDGFVLFQCTVVDDHGRGAAESWSGIDWIITAKITHGDTTIEKAILLQSKLGPIEDLNQREMDRLRSQIVKMRQLTRSPKVMEAVDQNGDRTPRIVSGNRVLQGKPYRSYHLGAYITGRVMPTLDGDTRPAFVRGVLDSRLTQVRLLAAVNR